MFSFAGDFDGRKIFWNKTFWGCEIHCFVSILSFFVFFYWFCKFVKYLIRFFIGIFRLWNRTAWKKLLEYSWCVNNPPTSSSEEILENVKCHSAKSIHWKIPFHLFRGSERYRNLKMYVMGVEIIRYQIVTNWQRMTVVSKIRLFLGSSSFNSN